MSHNYGMISYVDAGVLDKTLDMICERFPGQVINTCEVGVFDGQTSRGIYQYITSRTYDEMVNPPEPAIYTFNRKCNHTAIDNEKDKLVKPPFPECNFIRGNSNEVYNRLGDGSQHLIFVDGLHTFPAVVSDFFCYAPKVKVGGFIAFHDTGQHLDPLSGWQGVGSKDDPDMCLGGVRKALQTIGLLEPFINPNYENVEGGIYDEWDLVFDEADPNDTGGGICVFKKLY